jgi:hypothetical protein
LCLRWEGGYSTLGEGWGANSLFSECFNCFFAGCIDFPRVWTGFHRKNIKKI